MGDGFAGSQMLDRIARGRGCLLIHNDLRRVVACLRRLDEDRLERRRPDPLPDGRRVFTVRETLSGDRYPSSVASSSMPSVWGQSEALITG